MRWLDFSKFGVELLLRNVDGARFFVVPISEQADRHLQSTLIRLGFTEEAQGRLIAPISKSLSRELAAIEGVKLIEINPVLIEEKLDESNHTAGTIAGRSLQLDGQAALAEASANLLSDAGVVGKTGDGTGASGPAGQESPDREDGSDSIASREESTRRPRSNASRSATGRGRNSSTVRAVRSRVESPLPKNPNHFFLTNEIDRTTAGFSPSIRIEENLAAIRLLKEIEAAGRPVEPSEKAILAKYNGFGGLAKIFDQGYYYGENKWITESRFVLKELLTSDEMESARASVNNAHFSPPEVVREIWSAIEAAGFTGGLICEPAMGIGTFLGLMPKHIAEKSNIIAVEKDRLTGRMAQLIYPDAKIHIKGFEEVQFLSNSVDLVITNVPFGNFKVYDPQYRDSKLSIHDYFLVKSLDILKPGGILAAITSSYTLDKMESVARRMLHKRGILAGAIRLPDHAQLAQAGTSVTTDILFFVKRERPPTYSDNPLWLEAESRQEIGNLPVNRYFLEPAYRKSVLGQIFLSRGQDGRPRLDVKSDKPLKELINGATHRVGIPAALLEISAAQRVDTSSPPDQVNHARMMERTGVVTEGVGTYLIDEIIGDILVVSEVEDETLKAVPIEISGKPRTRLVGLIGIRDAMNKVFEMQVKYPDDVAGNEDARNDLNRVYDAFVKDHGFINLPANRRLFLGDPAAGRVFALENYDSEKKTATKADIFFRQIIAVRQEIESVETPVEALSVSLANLGDVYINDIGRLCGMSGDEVATQLEAERLIYFDPVKGRHDVAERYLSGDVRIKLNQVRMAEELEPGRYTRNIEALEKILPADIQLGDIDVRLGSIWVPEDIMAEFVADITGGLARDIAIKYDDLLEEWQINLNGWVPNWQKSIEYGTKRRPLLKLLDAGLNQEKVVVTDTFELPGGKTKTFVNEDETQAANEKLDMIKERFKAFLWESTDRIERLVRVYNDRFNNYVPPVYDGSHLTFPGMSAATELRRHQKNAVWRAIMDGNALFAHEVGTGKAQPLTARILTPNGWKLMGDIQVGDEVISVDGRPTKVIGVYPQGERLVYRVQADDGAETESCDEHLWSVNGEILPLSNVREMLIAGRKDLKIPVAEPVAMMDQSVPLDPYWMGVLLGSSINNAQGIVISEIHTGDEEIIRQLNLPEGVSYVLKNGRYWHAAKGRDKVEAVLKTLVVFGNKPLIPECYKFNSVEVRTRVLHGILDVGAFVLSKTQGVSIKSDSQPFLDDLAFLVRSLGGVLQIEKLKSCFNKEYGSQDRLASIILPAGFDVFRVSRKKQIRRKVEMPSRAIKTVIPVGFKEVQCIEVEHPSHLYITDDFMVTHNTMAMVATAMELKRLGKASMPVISVKNHMLEQVEREARQLYPNARILIVSKEDLSKSKRAEFLGRAANNEWDMVITTHSMLERIRVSDEFMANMIESEIVRYREEIEGNKNQLRVTVKRIEAMIKNLEARLKKYTDQSSKDAGIDMDTLGIDAIIVDESHNFKNLEVTVGHNSELSGGINGSERAFDLYLKSRWLYDKRQSVSGLIFASGTSVSNHVLEIFNLQRYLQPDVLNRAGVSKPSQWASTFLYPKSQWEPDPSGAGFKLRVRHGLQNVPELMSMLRQTMDVVAADDVQQLKRPECERINVAAEMSEVQHEIMVKLTERVEKIRAKEVSPKKDNLLRIVSDGRKMSIAPRLIDPEFPDFEGGKVNLAVKNIYEIWKETDDQRSTQLVFCDMGVPGKNGQFNVYDDVKAKLVARGIPELEIAYAQDAVTDQQKAELFAKVRAGDIRVLIGSTQSMGEGTNVQSRLVALHHLDAPWRPSDIEQRRGRMVRHGNENNMTREFIYTTEGSFDLFMWTTLKTKCETFSNVLRGDSGIRRFDIDVDPTYAETAAITSSDPRIKEKLELEQEISRLRSLYRVHENTRSGLSVSLHFVTQSIDNLLEKLEALRQFTVNPNFDMPVWTIRMDELGLDLENFEGDRDKMRDMIAKIMSAQEWDAISKGLFLNELPIHLEVVREGKKRVAIWRIGDGDSALHFRHLEELEAVVMGWDREINRVEDYLKEQQERKRSFEEEIEKPFAHQARLDELELRMNHLIAEIEASNGATTDVGAAIRAA